MSDFTVVQGDAFDALEELPSDFAECAIVDYPWEMDFKNGSGRFEGMTAERWNDWEKRGGPGYELEANERVPALLEELSRVLVDGAWVVCLADDDFQDVVRSAIRASPLEFRRNWAWTPKSIGMGYYGRINHYPIPVATNGETDRYVTGRGTLYEVDGGRNTEYPTGKPPALYRQLLEEPVVRDGDTLLEPFCGAGPGAAVANERGIDYWGCDTAADAVERTRERGRQETVTGWGDA